MKTFGQVLEQGIDRHPEPPPGSAQRQNLRGVMCAAADGAASGLNARARRLFSSFWASLAIAASSPRRMHSVCMTYGHVVDHAKWKHGLPKCLDCGAQIKFASDLRISERRADRYGSEGGAWRDDQALEGQKQRKSLVMMYVQIGFFMLVVGLPPLCYSEYKNEQSDFHVAVVGLAQQLGVSDYLPNGRDWP